MFIFIAATRIHNFKSQSILQTLARKAVGPWLTLTHAQSLLPKGSHLELSALFKELPLPLLKL